MTGQSQSSREVDTVFSPASEPRRRSEVGSLNIGIALPDDLLQLLGGNLCARSHKPEELICYNENELDHVAILTEGVLKLSRVLADGRELTVDLLFPGAVLGLCVEAAKTTEVWAATEVNLCYLPKSKFKKVMREHPELDHELLKVKLDQLDRARDRMMTLGRKSAGERVASFLLELAERQTESRQHWNDNQPLQFDLLLTRSNIADYLGLTVETVSRKIQQLARNGVITMKEHRCIVIEDLQALQRLSGS